jgi:hypothetical protein
LTGDETASGVGSGSRLRLAERGEGRAAAASAAAWRRRNWSTTLSPCANVCLWAELKKARTSSGRLGRAADCSPPVRLATHRGTSALCGSVERKSERQSPTYSAEECSGRRALVSVADPSWVSQRTRAHVHSTHLAWASLVVLALALPEANARCDGPHWEGSAPWATPPATTPAPVRGGTEPARSWRSGRPSVGRAAQHRERPAPPAMCAHAHLQRRQRGKVQRPRQLEQLRPRQRCQLGRRRRTRSHVFSRPSCRTVSDLHVDDYVTQSRDWTLRS